MHSPLKRNNLRQLDHRVVEDEKKEMGLLYNPYSSGCVRDARITRGMDRFDGVPRDYSTTHHVWW